jgi:hypothetical protein
VIGQNSYMTEQLYARTLISILYPGTAGAYPWSAGDSIMKHYVTKKDMLVSKCFRYCQSLSLAWINPLAYYRICT